MGIYQAQQGKYIRENEVVNKFFLFFSGIGNWVLNLFDANHYQIIDGERYRTEDQFYQKSTPDQLKNSDSSSVNASNSTNQSPTQSDYTNDENHIENLANNSAVLDIQNHEINNETM